MVNVSDRFKDNTEDINANILCTEDITYKYDDINVGSVPIITEFKVGFENISFDI